MSGAAAFYPLGSLSSCVAVVDGHMRLQVGSRLRQMVLCFFEAFCGSLRLKNFAQDLLSGQDPGLGGWQHLLSCVPASDMGAKSSLQQMQKCVTTAELHSRHHSRDCLLIIVRASPSSICYPVKELSVLKGLCAFSKSFFQL